MSLLRGSRVGVTIAIRQCRGARSTAQTINLAEPSPCPRPRQVQKLVPSAHQDPCPIPEQSQRSQRHIKVVRVNICKRKDLERACAPKFCDCPQRKAPRSMKQILACWSRMGVKVVFAVGLVYWTISEGIWGSAEDTEDFYSRIMQTVTGKMGDSNSLPHLEIMDFNFANSYNMLVTTVIGSLVAVPLKISKMIEDTLYPCESDEEPACKK